MPIVSISKIQHRYGLSENLPQLSAAELGWVIDQRRLYIGNGPTSEGAPSVGNTEILTEYSNILEVADDAYTYKDVAVGYTARTGTSATTPTTRSLQEKLDDFANVRDYGAKGDGVTDDTDAINRALFDIYCRDNNPQVRRTLYFPAGTYTVSDIIKIPTYANLRGDGLNCTIILAQDDNVGCVARTADSKQQTETNIGNNGATIPKYISISDISFKSNVDIDIFIFDSTSQTRFSRVGLIGPFTSPPNTSGLSNSSVRIYSTPINQSNDIFFDNCEFSGTSYAAILDDDMQNISFNNCRFSVLYRGLIISENTSGFGSSVLGPQSLKITNNLFDEIYGPAVYVYNTGSVISAFNTYLDVGNHNTGIAAENVIIFADNGNTSICDYFQRSDLQNASVARIETNNKKTVVIESEHGVTVGQRKFETGTVITLTDNVSNTSSGISFTTSQKSQKIFYLAERGTKTRSGVLTITATANGSVISDDFSEENGDLGLVFSVLVSGSTVTLLYTTTSTGSNITFTYSVDRIVL